MYTRKTPHFDSNADLGNLDIYSYKNNITEPATRPALPDMELVSHFLYASSADRDVTVFPDPFHFRIPFSIPFRDVHSVRIVQGIFPNLNNIRTQSFLILDVPELNSVVNAVTGNKCTALIQFAPHFGTPSFVGLDVRTMAPYATTFKPARSRLDGLTITLRKHDGTVFDAGAAAASSLDPLHQCTLMLEIVTKEPRVKQTL